MREKGRTVDEIELRFSGGEEAEREGQEGNLQGEPEPLERIVSSRHGKVSSADGRAVSILPIIVGLKGYLKKACIANSPPTWPISYEGSSRPLLPPQTSTTIPSRRNRRGSLCESSCSMAELVHRGSCVVWSFDTSASSVTRLHRERA